MEINEKVLAELAGQMGVGGNGGGSKEKMGKAMKMAESMKGMSGEELTDEILKVKSSLKSDPVQFQKQLKAFKALGVMMNEEQKMQMNKVIGILEKE